MATYTTYDQSARRKMFRTSSRTFRLPIVRSIAVSALKTSPPASMNGKRIALPLPPITRRSKGLMHRWQLCHRPRSAPTTRKSSPKRSGICDR